MAKVIDSPLVSVVMPAHNAEKHIEKAILSVLNQTLASLEVIVVDDCSNDGTLEVVKKVAQEHSRVRFEKLQMNSGAAGTPRNVGIGLAKGRYIFFLDSDDELDRHALKNLYFIADRDDCDFAMGQTVRYNLVSKQKQYWLSYLFREDVSNTSVKRMPELLNDTLITNKLFKKTFLTANELYFEDGIHYEDVIYSAHVLSKAKKISITRDLIYIWNIYDNSIRKSITNQRDSLKSLKDRLYANERRNEIYAILNDHTINRLCGAHFLRHSAILYLMDASDYNDSYLEAVIEMLYPVVSTLPDDYLRELDFPNRAIYAMLLMKDKRGLRELSYYRKYGNKLAGKIISFRSREYWVPSGTQQLPKNTHIRELIDITDSYISDTPVSNLIYYHEVRKIHRKKASVCLSGHSHDALTKYDTKNAIKATLIIEKRGEPELQYRFKVDLTRPKVGIFEWDVEIPNFNFSMMNGYEPWSIYIRMVQTETGIDNKSSVHVSSKLDLKNSTIRSLSPVRAFIGCGLMFYRSVNGNLSLRHVEFSNMAKAMGVYKRIISATHSLERAYHKVFEAVHMRLIIPIMKRTPIQTKVIFFESQLGQIATGSPLSVYEAILSDERFSNYRFVWSTTKPSEKLSNSRTKIIRRRSLKYSWHLSTAGALIDDQTFPGFFSKRTGQVYIQTWHGIPLKKMGLDEPTVSRNKIKSDDTIRRASMWDALITPSQYFIDTFANAFRYRGELIKWGTPRNDRLVSVDQSEVHDVKIKLDIPKNKKIILYAPTFRESNKYRKFDLPFSLNEWRERFGKDVFLLIRTHYLNHVNIPKALTPFCMDISSYPDLDELYLISDIMITDYSSTMFDYATLKRPIIFYAYDYEDYVNSERGTYFDLNKEAPGAIVQDEEGLFLALERAMKSKKPSKKYLKFIEKYCGLEDGMASKRVVEFLAREIAR